MTQEETETAGTQMIGRGLTVYSNNLQNAEEIFTPQEMVHGVGGGYGLVFFRSPPIKPAIWTENTEHVFLGNAEFWGCHVTSDKEYPLVFKVVKNLGYTYLSGRGEVKTERGKVHRLGYEDTTENVLPFLKSSKQLYREGAALALGWLVITEEERDRVVPSLIEALTDEAMEVRRNVAEALGRIGDPRAMEMLNKISTDDKDDWVREVAAESLSLIRINKAKTDRDVNALIDELGSKWILIRKKAAINLKEVGNKQAVKPLQEALEKE